MRASSRTTPKQRSQAPARRRRAAVSAAPGRSATPAPPSTRRAGGPEDRALRAGGPEDRALYVCHCGATFQSQVSASVRCPHCGEHQPW